jgi:hypothetical protein
MLREARWDPGVLDPRRRQLIALLARGDKRTMLVPPNARKSLTNRPVIVTQSDLPSSPLQRRGSPYSLS